MQKITQAERAANKALNDVYKEIDHLLKLCQKVDKGRITVDEAIDKQKEFEKNLK